MRLNDQSTCLAASRRPSLRALAGLVLFFVLSATAPAAEPARKATFVAGGKKIGVEQFEPSKKGKYPAVVLLHGIDGLHAGNQLLFRSAARSVADTGFVVLLIHYHDRTGTSLKDAPALLAKFQGLLENPIKNGKEHKALRELFDSWAQAVRDALAHARALPSVDRERVGLVGISLGGYLAAAVASEPAQRVGAVAVLFGGIPNHNAATLTHFPPALVLSGDQDQVVPVRESYRLRNLLRSKKLSCAEKVYEGIGHGFVRDGNPDLLTALAAQVEVATFLTKHLDRATGK
jgi:dienelactone hydrolase